MLHRHLNRQIFTLAAIDGVIGRGKVVDWADLRSAVLRDRMSTINRAVVQARQLMEEGQSLSKVAVALGMSSVTLWRRLTTDR